MGMALAMAIWSVVCVTTFLFARVTQSQDYRTFFRNLLGPLWPVFEVCYALFVILILAVFGAAAGAIAHAVFGAIGFTHEHSLHFLTRRLWAWRAEYGSDAFWAEQLGRTLAARGDEGLWPLVTAAFAETKTDD